MAELSDVPVTMFIRSAVVAHLAAEHRRLFPDVVATPWDAEGGQISEPVVRRVAEG